MELVLMVKKIRIAQYLLRETILLTLTMEILNFLYEPMQDWMKVIQNLITSIFRNLSMNIILKIRP